MRWLRDLGSFLRLVFSRHRPDAWMEDSPELEFEKERFRGMRGDGGM